jgi:hypothetical protein
LSRTGACSSARPSGLARVFADLDHVDLHTPKSIEHQFADVKRQAFAAKTPTQMLASQRRS